jgi:hypothetical protein
LGLSGCWLRMELSGNPSFEMGELFFGGIVT